MSKAAATWEHVGTLRPDPDNPVIHTDEEVAELQKLIADTVWTEPIVCRREDRQIIAGHRRLAAALLAIEGDPAWKLSDAPKPGTVPVRFVDVTVAQARRLNLASNALAKQSAWDEEVLARILREMDPTEHVGIGFDEDELRRLIDAGDAPPKPPASDDAPEVQQGPADSQPGRVYELGVHRLWCGDNTDPEIRAAASAGVQAVVTDPPYGIDYGRAGGFSASHGWGKWRENVDWDANRPPAESFAWMLSVSPTVVLWGGNYFTDLVPPTMGWLVWDKGQREFSLADCEMAWTSRQKAARVITYSRGAAVKDGKEHPTQKPIAVMVWTLEKTCEDIATVLDPFAGSGTTLIACAETGRVARCIELDPRYCDVIRRRWTRYARERGIDPGTGALDG